MPIVGGKIFSELAEALERLADGIAKHSKEENFPPGLKENEVRARRQQLESLREKYELLLSDARKVYDEYALSAKDSKNFLSKAQSLLEGFSGKRAQALADYGFKAWKVGGKKGPRKKQA